MGINIGLVTVIYKRPELTNFVLSYYRQQKIRLKNKLNISLICIGSEGEISKKIALDNGWEYYEFPNNPVSQKHNFAVEVCRNKDLDGVVYVGSDDIIDDVFFDEYNNCVNQGVDFLGFLDVYFLTKDKLEYWAGYSKNSGRYGEPIGPGKFFSRKLLERLNWRPWGNQNRDSGLDNLFWVELKKQKDLNTIVKKCKDIESHIIDIKTETNITKIESIKISETFDLNYIKKLNFDYEQIQPVLYNKINNLDLSILIATYKNTEFIDETLESIDKSKNNYNIEVLIGIDNCEETLNYIKSKKFPSYIRFFYFEVNNGPYIVFNSLSNIVSSENLLFFSSDDIMTPRMIGNVVEGFKKSQIVNVNYMEFYDKDLNNYKNKIKEAIGIFGIKKSYFSNLKGFQPWRCAADSEFLLRVEKNNITKTNTKDFDFFRRIHSKSLTQNSDTGVNSELRKVYKNIINNKTDFGPLERLETSTYEEISVISSVQKIKKPNQNVYDLTIIISTYLNTQYLEECFNSIIKSINGKKVQVLVGIDSCIETKKHITQRSYPEYFEFYFFEKNNGPYVVFNSLSELVKSEKILFFGSDDVMLPNMVEDCISGLDNIDCVKPIYTNFFDGKPINSGTKRHIGEGVFAIKKEIFDYMNGFEPWMCGADSDFMGRMYQLKKFSFKITSRINFYRRIHKNGLTSRPDTGLGSKLRAEYLSSVKSRTTFGPISKKVTEPFYKLKGGEILKENNLVVTEQKNISPLKLLSNKKTEIKIVKSTPKKEESKKTLTPQIKERSQIENKPKEDVSFNKETNDQSLLSNKAKDYIVDKKIQELKVKPKGYNVGKDSLRI